MENDGSGEERWTLENTPTWAVATVCAVFVSIALLINFVINKIEHMLKEANRKPLAHALEKMKEELMLLGFIAFMLTAFQNYVAGICVKSDIMYAWTPCHAEKPGNLDGSDYGMDYEFDSFVPAAHSPEDLFHEAHEHGRRRLLSSDMWPQNDGGSVRPLFNRRVLNQNMARVCKIGYSSFVSPETLHELHTLMFVMAVVHIVYSLFVMLLASTRVNEWKAWEDEARNQDAGGSNVQPSIKSSSLQRQSTFIQHHTSNSWNRNSVFVWIICFFRQFGRSVRRSDYLALRQGFITTHHTGRQFDFHSYILRSLEDEYGTVVGITASLWFLVVLFTLFNVFGANLFFWLCFVPAVLLLLVGAKLQQVIATLALESAGFTRGGQYFGKTLKPRDELFWFGRPQLTLNLIHLILFQNAFEMATFLAFAWQFGLKSCLMRRKSFVYTRLAVGVLVQILCSYSTLPLYALVSQMGSHYKQAIFQPNVKDKLELWRKGAQKRVRQNALAVAAKDTPATTAHKKPPMAPYTQLNQDSPCQTPSTESPDATPDNPTSDSRTPDLNEEDRDQETRSVRSRLDEELGHRVRFDFGSNARLLKLPGAVGSPKGEHSLNIPPGSDSDGGQVLHSTSPALTLGRTLSLQARSSTTSKNSKWLNSRFYSGPLEVHSDAYKFQPGSNT